MDGSYGRALSAALLIHLSPHIADLDGSLKANEPAASYAAALALRHVRLRRLGALAPAAPLVAVLLDLAGQLLGDEVDRVPHVVGALGGAEGDALQVQGHLGDLGLADRRIPLLPELDLQL